MKTITLPAGRSAEGAPSVRIEVDETDHIGRIIARGTWYEKDLLDDARHRISAFEPGTAVDVGAHIGNHALWFALAMRLNVVALEPNPVTFERLARNLELNDLRVPDINRPYVRALPVAAGARPGWGRVQSPALAGNSGTVAVKRDRGEFQQDAGQVPITTIDELALDDVRLIKIDVEGAAASVLVGAADTIAAYSPVIYAEGDRHAIQDALPKGYRCFGCFAKTPTFGFARG
jgi:FkbM family methyltransferase